jgi:uncharacterized protein
MSNFHVVTVAEARELAGLWHGGMMSGLYKISCNETHEKLTREDFEKAIEEVNREIIYETGREERAELQRLKRYLVAALVSKD